VVAVHVTAPGDDGGPTLADTVIPSPHRDAHAPVSRRRALNPPPSLRWTRLPPATRSWRRRKGSTNRSPYSAVPSLCPGTRSRTRILKACIAACRPVSSRPDR
jgi:hypothetical protein